MRFEGFCYSVWVAAVCREPVELEGRESEMKGEEGGDMEGEEEKKRKRIYGRKTAK